jgi:hypothetical protein
LPRPETYDTDPRIAETQAILEMSEQIVPGLMAFHPMGALVGQECVRITAGQFCSMIFSVQYRLPSYTGGCCPRPTIIRPTVITECFCSTCSLGLPDRGC